MLSESNFRMCSFGLLESSIHVVARGIQDILKGDSQPKGLSALMESISNSICDRDKAGQVLPRTAQSLVESWWTNRKKGESAVWRTPKALVIGGTFVLVARSCLRLAPNQWDGNHSIFEDIREGLRGDVCLSPEMADAISSIISIVEHPTYSGSLTRTMVYIKAARANVAMYEEFVDALAGAGFLDPGHQNMANVLKDAGHAGDFDWIRRELQSLIVDVDRRFDEFKKNCI